MSHTKGMKEQIVCVRVYIDRALHKQLKAKSKMKRRSMSAQVGVLIEEWVEE